MISRSCRTALAAIPLSIGFMAWAMPMPVLGFPNWAPKATQSTDPHSLSASASQPESSTEFAAPKTGDAGAWIDLTEETDGLQGTRQSATSSASRKVLNAGREHRFQQTSRSGYRFRSPTRIRGRSMVHTSEQSSKPTPIAEQHDEAPQSERSLPTAVPTKPSLSKRLSSWSAKRRMTAAKIQQVAATADSVKRTKTAASRAESQRVAESIARTMKAAELDQHNIAVQFEDGVARLSGWVSSEKQKKKATRVVGRVQGVRWIDNRLELAPNKPAGLARRLAISRRPAKVQPRFAEQRPQQRKSFGSALRPASWKRPQESHSGRPSGGFPNSVRNLGVFSRLGNSAPSVGLERHYDTLGLRNGASSRDVVRAYMQQARQLHTQQYSQDAGEAGIAQSRMQAINEAFRAIKLAQRPKTTPPGRSDSVDDHLNRGQVVLTGATSAASRRDSNGPRAPRRLKRSGREAQLPWSVNRGW